MITVATLIAAGIGPTQARIFAEPLHAACVLYGIDTPPRVAAFVGQCRVESDDFTQLEENLHYRRPDVLDRNFSNVRGLAHAAQLIALGPKAIANCAYANRNGNGDEASGDGWRYIGRGLIQLTGRANYTRAALAMRKAYVDRPELVGQPVDACLVSAWFWHSRGLNALADAALTDHITRKVNGEAMLHADLRRQYTEEAQRAFA